MNLRTVAGRSTVGPILACLALAFGCLWAPVAANGTAIATASPPVKTALRLLAAVHRFVGVAVSPDGQRVAWVEVIPAADPLRAGHSVLFLKELRAPNNAAERVRAAGDGREHDEHGIAWSPDAKRIAFLAQSGTRGQSQVYLMDVASKAVRRLTDVKGDLADLRWSPDGRSLAFLFIPNAPRTPGPLGPTARDAGVVESKVYEQRIAVLELNGGRLRMVSPPDLYVYEYDWSPDGTKFAISAAHGNGDNNWWIAKLYSLSASSGQLRPIASPPLQLAQPRWSADGKTIAYIGGIMSDEGSTGGDIFEVAAQGGQPKDLTPGMQGSVTWIAWSTRAPNRIVFTENVNGSFAVATLDAASGAIAQKWTGPQLLSAQDAYGISVARDGERSAVVRSSFSQAPEVWAGAIGSWRQITHSNDRAARLWGPARSVEWSSDALKVQGWLLSPLGYDAHKHYPMVVVVHGGPAAANVPAWPQGYSGVLASQGYFVFLPNPRGSFGQGEAFAQANVKDFGYGDFRDIVSGIKAAEAVAPIDDARVGIFGWSYGGYMTMWAVTQTDRFRAAVAGAGLANWQSYYGENGIDQWMIPYFGASVYEDPAVYARSSPITFIKKVKTPTLVLQGERDAEVPAPQAYEFWHALKTLGVPTQLVIYPDEGHRIAMPEHQQDAAMQLVGWFDKYLKSQAVQ